MRSKTSYFSRTIFLNTLKRFWPLFAAYLVIWLLIVPLPINATLQNAAEHDWDGTADVALHLMNSGRIGGVFMSFAFAALFAMAAFSYLYNNRSVSQMSSLPVKREGVFLSMLLPGFSVMLASNLITFLTAIAVAASYGVSIAGYALQALAMVCLMNLFFYGFATFCAMLTGHILVLPAVYVVLNLAVAGAVFLVYNVLDRFVYGLASSGGFNSLMCILSPIVYIIGLTRIDWPQFDAMGNAVTSGYSYNGWTYLFIIAAAGIVFVGLAMLLLRRRRMETAGDVVAIRPLKPVFKYCLTAACALGAGIGLYYLIFPYNYTTVGFEGMATILALMLLGAFVGYFAAEMLMQKTLRVFSTGKWKGFGAAALILIVLTFACEYDIFGYERRVPDAEQVESVTMYGNYSPVTITDSADIQTVTDIHSSLVKNKALHEGNEYRNYNYYPTLYLEYALKDGSFVTRRYYISPTVTEDCDAILDFLNTPKNILLRNDPGMEVNEWTIDSAYINILSTEDGYNYNYRQEKYLSLAEATELYNECLLPDMLDGTIGLLRQDWYYDAELDGKNYTCEIYFHLSERSLVGEYTYGNVTFRPNVDSVRTNAWLTEHGVELFTYNDIGEGR